MILRNRKLDVTGLAAAAALAVFALSGCTTKAELKRQQELERIKQEVTVAKSAHVDTESQIDEVRTDLQKLSLSADQQAAALRAQTEDLRKEMAGLVTRLSSLEQRLVEEEMARKALQAELRAGRDLRDDEPREEKTEKKPAEEKKHLTYDQAKKLFDEKKYAAAIDALRGLLERRSTGAEAKNARFLLGEALFQSKEYAPAALAFDDFKKQHPNDAAAPQAMYRQANAFRLLGKKDEARLFYQDLLEKFPKSNQAAKAKNELKKLK